MERPLYPHFNKSRQDTKDQGHQRSRLFALFNGWSTQLKLFFWYLMALICKSLYHNIIGTNHCMAFYQNAKTTSTKIVLKRQVLKKIRNLELEICNLLPNWRLTSLYCLGCKLPGYCQELKQGLELPIALTNKPITHVKVCYLYMYMKTFLSAECWTCISQWPKFCFPIFLLPNPEVSIYSVSVC